MFFIYLLVFSTFSIYLYSQDINNKLIDAVSNNKKYDVEKLLSQGANPNFVVELGFMKVHPLIKAVLNNNYEIVKLLLDNKADIDFQDGFQTTALIYSSSLGYLDITKLLVENKARLSLKDQGGKNALQSALESKNEEIINYLTQIYQKDSIYNFEINIEIADSLNYVLKKFPESIKYYDLAISFVPDAPYAYYMKATALFASKKFSEAINNFGKAIEYEYTDLARAYFMRGLSKTLLPIEDWVGGCKDMKKAISLGYDVSGLKDFNTLCK